jgi:Leishmanolysin
MALLCFLMIGLTVAQSGSFPLQIVTHYDAMTTKFSSKTGTELDKYLFSKQIMIRVVKYYSTMMTIKYASGTFSYSAFTLNGGLKVSGGSFTGHLFTVFDCFNEASTTFASAGFQDRDSTNGRPISGIFSLNLNAIKPSPKNALAHYGTFVHEFYHILTFNSDLYQYYIGSGSSPIGYANVIGTVSGRQALTYSSSAALAWAKTFLGDTTLASLILENGGGAGSAASHWEYDYWPTDFMSPIDTLPSLLSPLSLYLSKDAGWYDVKTEYADPMIYGKSAGANFQSTATCPGNRSPKPLGFCSTSEVGTSMCSPDGMYKGYCGANSDYNNNGNCPFIMGSLYCTVPSDDYTGSVNYDVELIGPGNRCALSKSSGGSYAAVCVTTTCPGGNSLSYKFNGGSSCTCSASDAGNDKTCGSYTVKCPDTTSIQLTCEGLDTTKHRCPNDCSGKGFCLGLNAGTKTCWCKYGWTGADCSTENADEKPLTSVGTVTTANNNKSSSFLHPALTGFAGLLLMILSSFI